MCVCVYVCVCVCVCVCVHVCVCVYVCVCVSVTCIRDKIRLFPQTPIQFFEVAEKIWNQTRDKKINFLLISPMDNSFHESTGELTFIKLISMGCTINS